MSALAVLSAGALLSGCGASAGAAKPWAASVCKTLRPQWAAASSGYSTMMKSVNDPGADPGALTWGQVTSDLNRVNKSFLALETTASAAKSERPTQEIAKSNFFTARTADQSLSLDTASWAAGLTPAGKAIGGAPSDGLAEVRRGVEEFCG